MIIKIIFGILCLLAGIFWAAVSMYGMRDALRCKDIFGILISCGLMLMSAVVIVGAIKYCFL